MSDFHLLLEEQIPQMLRYAAALTRDADQAAELVEDTVREALVTERTRRGDLRVWLLTTLHDVRGNPFRAMTLDTTAVSDAEARLTLSQLDRALGRLPENRRAALLLVGLERLSYTDAAAVLRITPATLRSRLSCARADLRRLMGVAEPARVARAA